MATPWTRRGFLQCSSAAAILKMLHQSGSSRQHVSLMASDPSAARDVGATLVDPAMVQTLALRAIDAARSAGAQYADVRLTRTVGQTVSVGNFFGEGGVGDRETLHVGVRALIDGRWGFAASPYWEDEEVVRLGREAVVQAKITTADQARAVDLGTVPVAKGHWIMPVQQDPLLVSLEEKLDFLEGVTVSMQNMLNRNHGDFGFSGSVYEVSFERQERAFASTDNAYVTQTVYVSGGGASVTAFERQKGFQQTFLHIPGLEPSGRGWEMFDVATVLDRVPAMVSAVTDLAYAMRAAKPVEPSRYTIVCDAMTMAGLVDATFGRATELDRALGYEANASGTSYLGPDPFAFLGTAVASPVVSVTANRSLPGGLATVQWDDDGVVPADFSIVHQGTLVDYQTTREHAAWLQPWYAKRGQPVQSHGCAMSADASAIPLPMTPNLALTPSASASTFDDLVAGTEKGIAFLHGYVTADFQARTGTVLTVGRDAVAREIQHGKLGPVITNAAMLFNASDLWKNVPAVGGATSVEAVWGKEQKGEPAQTTYHTVSAVPAVLKEQAVIDVMRRA